MIGIINTVLTSTGWQKCMDQNRIARGLGGLADSTRLPRWLLKKIISAYINQYQIDMDEFNYNIDTAKCFNEFFARPLKPDRRQLGSGIISPVDGQLTQYDTMTAGDMLQVKGKPFLLQELVGEVPQFKQGYYVIIYLAPGDYHRFHAPFDLQAKKIRYLPGELLATSAASLAREDRVYCRNERIVLSGTSDWGAFYFIAVGATAVGRICLTVADIKSNQAFGQARILAENLPDNITQGAELGYFELGSTVVLAVENQALTTMPWQPGARIKMGETLWC